MGPPFYEDLQRRRARDLPPPRRPTRTEGSPPPRSSHAASSTASSLAPLALKAATTEPSGLSKSNRSGSRRRRYPSGRFGSNLPLLALGYPALGGGPIGSRRTLPG